MCTKLVPRMVPDIDYCFVCLDDQPPLLRVCKCNTLIHKECFRVYCTQAHRILRYLLFCIHRTDFVQTLCDAT